MRVKDDWRDKVKKDMVAVCPQRLKVDEGKVVYFILIQKCVDADTFSLEHVRT